MKKNRKNQLLTLSVLTVAAMCIIPDLAFAGTGPWDKAATQILAIFTGGLTRTIGIIAVIACGLSALAGKLSWDWAIKIIVGIVLIFGSTAIVDYVISAST